MGAENQGIIWFGRDLKDVLASVAFPESSRNEFQSLPCPPGVDSKVWIVWAEQLNQLKLIKLIKSIDIKILIINNPSRRQQLLQGIPGCSHWELGDETCSEKSLPKIFTELQIHCNWQGGDNLGIK